MLVTIIMPTFNTPYDYLNESVNSILCQSYEDIQLLIIDDHSTKYNDDSFWADLKLRDKRITVLQNNHKKGVAGALNTGLDCSAGKYIFRMDADDISTLDRIEKQVNYMENNPQIDVLCGYAKCFGDSSAVNKTLKGNDCIKASLLFGTPITHPTVCFRSSTINQFNIRYKEEIQNEDYELWTRLALISDISFDTYESIVLNYRIHKNQVTQSRLQLLIEQGINLRMDFLISICSNIEKKDAENFANLCLHRDIRIKKPYLLFKRIYSNVFNSPIFNDKKSLAKVYWKNCLQKTLKYDLRYKRFNFLTIVFCLSHYIYGK